MGNSAGRQLTLAGPFWLLEDTFVMYKFKLLAGTHIEEDGKEYKVGDTVESSVDLVALFHEKFERITTAPAFRPSTLVTNPQTKAKAPAESESKAPSKPSVPEDDEDEEDDEPEVKKGKSGKSGK